MKIAAVHQALPLPPLEVQAFGNAETGTATVVLGPPGEALVWVGNIRQARALVAAIKQAAHVAEDFERASRGRP